MTSGYLKRTCVRVALFAHLMQIFTPAMAHASDTDYQYRLKIQTLNLESEKYRVEVSRRKMDSPEVDQVEQVVQRLDMEQGRIKDHFIRHAPDGQDVLYGKFSGAAVKTYEGESDIRFVYNIPGFGQIKMMKGGKAFFIQGADDTSLSQYEVSVESTGDLMIANLKVLGLVMQSQNLLLDNVSSSQQLSYVNNGILQLKNSMLSFSSLTNNGTLELYSGQYTVDCFYKSNLLRFLENDWTLSSSHSAASNRFVVLRTLDLVEKIESEKNLIYSKLGDLPKISCQSDIFFPKGYMTYSMACLANIEAGGKVTIWCKPDDQIDLDCSNIANLELNLIGACARKHFLKAQTLTLNVDGSLTLGASNEQLGAIAATSGPLTVNAHSIDGRFGKFYGFGPTLLKSTKGDILVGSPLFGVDPEFKEWYRAAQEPLDLTHVVPEEHQYYRELYDRCAFLERSFKCNGAYFSSNAKIIVESAKNIIAEFGVVFGGQGTSLKALEKIQNLASKIYSLGLISIRGLEYIHTAKDPERVSYDGPYSGNCPGMWSEHPTSGPALLSSIGDINFHVQKITSRGSTILTQGNIFVNGVQSVKKDNVEFLPSFNGSPVEFRWTNHCYYDNWLTAVLFSLPNIIQSGKNIQIHTGDFTISGSTSTRGVFSIRANQALFYNNSRVRSDRYHTNFNVFDLTQSLNEKAQSGDPLFRLGNNGAIETEFPMGNPSMPDDGQVVMFDDGGLPIQQIPMNLLPIFNPLSGINLDLHVLSAMARLTGKVFLNSTDEACSAKALWDNARRWKESMGKELVTFNDLHNIKEAMLMFQIRQVGNMLQRHTLICTPASENNPYKSEGDHVAGSISSVTDGNQQLLNSRLVAQGNIDIKSNEGAVDMQTQSYSEFYVVDGAEITQDYAMPQQQIISMTGSANVSSQHDLTHTGDLMRAVSSKQTSNAGSLKDNPLILKRFVKSEREESRGWSTKRIIETSLTHSALTSTIVVDETLHDKAAVSIDLVAPQYYAGKEILFQTPKTNIKAKLLANRSTSHAVEKGAFTKTETFNSTETPFAEPANINAPVVTFEGKDAVINANISSGEIRDQTDNGIKFVAEVIQLLSSGQTLVDSPLCSVDAGYKAGYETMMPCMLMVEKIICTKEGGEMLFESVLMDDRAEIIGKFVKTTYELKQWQTSWCHVEQVVPNEIIIAAAIAITILTKGAGAKVMAPLIKGVTAATGMALSPIGITMVNAGFSAFCAAATSNTLRSGDPIQVAKQMVSLEQLKSIGITMASAGLCSQLGGMLDINMEPGIKELSMHLKEQALRGTVDTILNVSINQTPVDEALSDAIKQIPLKAVAAYAANQICWSINEPLGVKALHTALGGLAGFAMEGNRDGVVAGAIGALTAQVVGDILMSDAHAIADAAVKNLNEDGKPLTPENVTAAIQAEVNHKADLAKIAAAGVAALLKKNPNTTLFTATNVMENDITIRQSIYVMAELQKLLTAAAMAKAAVRVEETIEVIASPVLTRAPANDKGKEEADDTPAAQEMMENPGAEKSINDALLSHLLHGYQEIIWELSCEKTGGCEISAEERMHGLKKEKFPLITKNFEPINEAVHNLHELEHDQDEIIKSSKTSLFDKLIALVQKLTFKEAFEKIALPSAKFQIPIEVAMHLTINQAEISSLLSSVINNKPIDQQAWDQVSASVNELGHLVHSRHIIQHKFGPHTGHGHRKK